MPPMSMKQLVVPLMVPLMVPLIVHLMVPLMAPLPYMFSVSVVLRRIYDARCSYGASTIDVDYSGTSYGSSMLMVPPNRTYGTPYDTTMIDATSYGTYYGTSLWYLND